MAPHNLVVEVLSPSSVKLDEKIKRTRYSFFGVAESWIVDPEAERVRVFRLRGNTLDPVAVTPFDVFHSHEA